MVQMKRNPVKPNVSKTSLSRKAFLSGTAALTAGWMALGATRSMGRNQPGLYPDSGRILVKGGCVLTMDPDIGDFEKADILISGSEISDIQQDITPEDDMQIIDASYKIVMPGFVDTHRHMWQGSIRNILPDGLLGDYVQQILGIREHYRPDDVFIGNLVSALGAINAGVTTVLDWSHIGNSPEHTDAAIAALEESGIRAVYGFGGGAAGPDNQFPDDIVRLRNTHFSSEDQLLTLALAGGLNESQWAIARDVDARISVHVNGTGQLLPFADLLGPDVTCIHCPNLLDEEWELLAGSGASVSIAGPIEMQMGHGIPPIQQCLDYGIKPSLSVDVETQMPGDMFTQLLSIFTLQRMQILSRQRAGEENLPELLSVRDVVEFATRQGAIDNGLGQVTGTLTPGNKADLILLDMKRINVFPVNNAYGAIVHGFDTGNVDTVIIDGKIKKWQGELVDVDLDRILEQAAHSRDYILKEAGVSASII
jgi:5-methylthioadenosine/S-adenosylhomocysteine deaminase